MRAQSLLAVVVLALEGASAHPTVSHGHLHHKLSVRDVLSKRIEYDTSKVDFTKVDYSKVDWDKVFGRKGKGGSSDTAATTEKKTPQKSTDKSEHKSDTPKPDSHSASSGGSGKCLDVTKLNKRATVQQDSYLGNSVNNIHPEANCKSSGDYSLTFDNKRGSKKTYWLWNKAGTGTKANPNGMMTDAAYIFDLEDGQKATFTLDANSLVGFSEDCGRAVKNGNVPNCNVGEASFADGNTAGGSDGGSFYDVSMVPFTQISKEGGSPTKIPMTISAPGRDDSSMTQCNYIEAAQNQPGNFPSGKDGCVIGNRDSSPLHVTTTFG